MGSCWGPVADLRLQETHGIRVVVVLVTLEAVMVDQGIEPQKQPPRLRAAAGAYVRCSLPQTWGDVVQDIWRALFCERGRFSSFSLRVRVGPVAAGMTPWARLRWRRASSEVALRGQREPLPSPPLTSVRPPGRVSRCPPHPQLPKTLSRPALHLTAGACRRWDPTVVERVC
ncbi:hypothetical protein VULLAG_LOCUS8215 [Vulpes lagopus]